MALLSTIKEANRFYTKMSALKTRKEDVVTMSIPRERLVKTAVPGLCPYTDQTCDYQAVPDCEQRGLEIMLLRELSVNITVIVEGEEYDLEKPSVDDFCETCQSSPDGRRPCVSYLAEALYDLLGE